MSSIATTATRTAHAPVQDGYNVKVAYRRFVEQAMKGSGTRLSSTEGMAPILVDCMVAPARRVDLAIRYEDLGLYRDAILENLSRKDDSEIRIVFHDTGFRSIMTLPPQLEGPFERGRVKLYAYGGDAHFDDFLMVGMMGGTVHTRTLDKGDKAAVVQFRQSAEGRRILGGLFDGMVSRAVALTP